MSIMIKVRHIIQITSHTCIHVKGCLQLLQKSAWEWTFLLGLGSMAAGSPFTQI